MQDENNLANHTSMSNIIIKNEEAAIIWVKIKQPLMKELNIGCHYGPQEKTEKDLVTEKLETMGKKNRKDHG